MFYVYSVFIYKYLDPFCICVSIHTNLNIQFLYLRFEIPGSTCWGSWETCTQSPCLHVPGNIWAWVLRSKLQLPSRHPTRFWDLHLETPIRPGTKQNAVASDRPTSAEKPNRLLECLMADLGLRKLEGEFLGDAILLQVDHSDGPVLQDLTHRRMISARSIRGLNSLRDRRWSVHHHYKRLGL